MSKEVKFNRKTYSKTVLGLALAAIAIIAVGYLAGNAIMYQGYVTLNAKDVQVGETLIIACFVAAMVLVFFAFRVVHKAKKVKAQIIA